MNWKWELKNYHEFMDWEEVEVSTEEEAKNLLKEDLEHMIALNGAEELYESELALCKKLGIEV